MTVQSGKLWMHADSVSNQGGGSTAKLGGQELTLLCGFNQYALLQNRDNIGLLGTPLCYSLKLGGGGGTIPPPMLKLGERPPPPLVTSVRVLYNVIELLS